MAKNNLFLRWVSFFKNTKVTKKKKEEKEKEKEQTKLDILNNIKENLKEDNNENTIPTKPRFIVANDDQEKEKEREKNKVLPVNNNKNKKETITNIVDAPITPPSLELSFNPSTKEESLQEINKKENENEKEKKIEIEKQGQKPKKKSIPSIDETSKKKKEEKDDDVTTLPKQSAPSLNINQEETKVTSPKDEQITDTHIPNNTKVISKILLEIDEMLKANFYEVKKIEFELNSLEEDADNHYLIDELNAIIQKLQRLLIEFENIKKQFYKEYPSLLVEDINNYDIEDLIIEYKTFAKSGKAPQSSIMQLEQTKEYINIIDAIMNIENRTNTLNNKLRDKKEEMQENNKNFNIFSSNVQQIVKIDEQVEAFTKTQNYILKEIDHKLQNSVNITKTVEYKTELVFNYSRFLNATLLVATTSLLPFNKGGNILRAGLMIAAITNLTKLYSVRTSEDKTNIKVSYIDYENDIKKNINNVEDMSILIDNAINDIKYLKKSFQKDFLEYADIIPEYSIMMLKLNDIEKDLIVKNKIAKEYEQHLNNSLDKNNVKIKKIEEER